MTRIIYEEALEKVKKEYDAFYIENKYGECTHSEEFNLLKQVLKDDELSLRALSWIRYEYDCYYEKEQDDDPNSAFNYLRSKLKEMGHLRNKI